MIDFKETLLFRTIVEILPLEPLINPSNGLVFLGSCFAQNVGERFLEYGFSALVNPLGTLYNPYSIFQVLSQAAAPDVESHIFDAGGTYRCWLAGTRFQADTPQDCAKQVKQALGNLCSALASSRYLFLTLGTSVAYALNENGRIVCNCHRMPQTLFDERRLSVQDCVDLLNRSVDSALSIRPDIRVVFTVSPYRYAKYGFHESRVAKSVLLLAVDEICKQRPESCSYFPSYEILLDELRDYRFYAPDMLHPSPQAVDYIWHRLVQTSFDSSAQAYLRDYEPVRKGLLHRPLNPESAQEKERVQRLLQRQETLRQRYAVPQSF